MDQLAERFNNLLGECLRRGMELPFILTFVGGSGSFVAIRYEQGESGLRSQIMAEHSVGEAVVFPINCMLVDKSNHGVHAVFTANDVTFH